MPIPAHLTPITVTRRYLAADGTPLSGTVQFRLSAYATVPVDDVTVPPVDVVAVLDPTGQLKTLTGQPLILPASDDPDWAQSGLVYRVTERIAGAPIAERLVNIPAAAIGGTVDLADLAEATPGPALVTYVLAAQVGQPGGPASLDGTGKVPAAQIPATGSVPDATPTAKGVVQLAGDLAGTATAPTVPGLAGKADTAAVNAGLAGRATKPVVRRAYITTGDVTLAANAAWTPLAGFELALPAAVGDDVELSVGALLQSSGSDFFDLVVLTGGPANTIARRASTGTAAATVAGEGDPGLYPNASGSTFRVSNGVFGFTVTPADLDGGNVRFALVVKGSGGGKIFASTSYPYRWRAINRGPVD